jgi:hypothetical protein
MLLRLLSARKEAKQEGHQIPPLIEITFNTTTEDSAAVEEISPTLQIIRFGAHFYNTDYKNKPIFTDIAAQAPNVTQLALNSSYKPQSNKLPPLVRTLDLSRCDPEAMDFFDLSNVRSLSLPQRFDRVLSSVKNFPAAQLTKLELGQFYDQPIDVVLPNLVTLDLGHSFSRELPKFTNKLKHLILSDRFNGPIQDKIPKEIETLGFLGPVSYPFWPDGLTHLKSLEFSFGYTFSSNGRKLPETLKTLILYQTRLDNLILPPQLEFFQFNRVYNSVPCTVKFPSTLTVLHCGNTEDHVTFDLKGTMLKKLRVFWNSQAKFINVPENIKIEYVHGFPLNPFN